MTRRITVIGLFFLSTLLAAAIANQASAIEFARRTAARNATQSWNGMYYKAEWGMPLAVVVPPTAKSQSDYSWGVPSYRTSPVAPQYAPGYPEAGVYQRRLFRPVPSQPSDTTQLGVYSVRGPW